MANSALGLVAWPADSSAPISVSTVAPQRLWLLLGGMSKASGSPRLHTEKPSPGLNRRFQLVVAGAGGRGAPDLIAASKLGPAVAGIPPDPLGGLMFRISLVGV